jgi:3-deoxy-D-manno-octulosonic acid kinase
MDRLLSVSSVREVFNVRVDSYACRLAHDLTGAEIQALVGALEKPNESGPGVLGGRAAVWRHEIPSVGAVVIKEYRRGGLWRYVTRRHYLRVGRTRPEREFEILLAASAAGLSVPDPVACLSRGAVFYRGWLVTRFIEGESLVEVGASDVDALAPLIDELTRQVRLLIENRIAHVDLHPGNVLVDVAGTLHLLDFDKATLFEGSAEELRDYYHFRWRRAVAKHGLPPILSERLTAGLYASADQRDS